MRKGAAAVRSGQYKAAVAKERAVVEDGVVRASPELACIVLHDRHDVPNDMDRGLQLAEVGVGFECTHCRGIVSQCNMLASEGVQSRQHQATAGERQRHQLIAANAAVACHASLQRTAPSTRLRITHHASPMQPKYKVQSPCQLSPLNSKILPQAPVLHHEPAQWRWQT